MVGGSTETATYDEHAHITNPMPAATPMRLRTQRGRTGSHQSAQTLYASSLILCDAQHFLERRGAFDDAA